MNKRKSINKKIFSHLISIIFVVLFLIVATVYVYYPNKADLLSSLAFIQNQEEFYLEEIYSSSNLTAPYPVTDEEGMNNEAYEFKIVNTTNKTKQYQLIYKNQTDKIEKRNLTPLESKYLRYYIVEEGKENNHPETIPESEIIYESVIEPNSEVTFTFRVWLDENCDENALGKTYIGRMELKEI